MVDVAYLGIAVDSSQADKASGSLKQLSGAAKQADAATQGYSQSAQKSEAASKRAEAAAFSLQAAQQRLAIAQKRVNDLMNAGPQPLDRMTKANAQLASAQAGVLRAQAAVSTAMQAHTTAANDNSAANTRNAMAAKANAAATAQLAASTKMAAFQQRMLVFQLNDVFVSLASGMNPMMVAIQQGSQMAQVYSGEGGLGRSLKETARMAGRVVSRFPLVAASVAAVSLAFAGMAHEMEKATGQSVSFRDVAQASFIVVRDAIYSVLQPAIAAISPWFSAAWDSVVTATKAAGNFIVGAMVGATNAVIVSFRNMAAPIGQVFADIQNTVYDATLWVSRRMHELLNPGSDGNMAIPRQAYAENPFADIGGRDVVGAFMSAFDTDYMADFYNAVQNQVISQLKAAGEEAGGTGNAIKTAMDTKPVDLMGKSLEKANDQMNFASSLIQSFIGDLRSGIQEGQSFWDAFRKAGMNALNSLLDKMIEMATNQLVMSMFGFPAGGGGSPMLAPAAANAALGSGFRLFSSGGYTGDMATNRPAGVVHGQEFVVNAAATKRNRKTLEAMNSGAPMGGGVSVLEVRLDARTEARVLEAAEGQTVRIVRAAAPGMAEAGARKAQQSFADQPTRWQR